MVSQCWLLSFTDAGCSLKDGRELNVGVHTTHEKMNLDVCGSSEDARHRTIPKHENLMSAHHLTRKGGSEEQKQGASHQQSWVSSLIICGKSFSFSGSQLPDMQSGTNNACPTCLVSCVCAGRGFPLRPQPLLFQCSCCDRAWAGFGGKEETRTSPTVLPQPPYLFLSW